MIYIPFMVANSYYMRTTINNFGKKQQELYVDTACVTRVSILIHCNIFLMADPMQSQLEQQQQCSTHETESDDVYT